MKTISLEELKVYEKYIYNRARDIEIAKYNYHFNDGEREDVAMALSIYQNRDGGFGHGYFTFKETKIENGLKYKTLTEGDLLRIKIINGYSRKVFDYMVPCDNETLKTLNLTENIDENLIWQKYYDNLSKNNVLIGNDVETIKKTPPNFLTNTQKEVIKSEYISRFNEFDVYHRNNNANEVDDIIINELAVTFLKGHAVIKSIITQL